MVIFLLLNPDFEKRETAIKQLFLSESSLEKTSYDGRGWGNKPKLWNLVCLYVTPNTKGSPREDGRAVLDTCESS